MFLTCRELAVIIYACVAFGGAVGAFTMALMQGGDVEEEDYER